MGKFKNYLIEQGLFEMSIAGYGDWEPSQEMIGTKSAFIVKNKCILRGKIKTRLGNEFLVYKLPLGDEYIAGLFKQTTEDEEIFEVVLKIKLKEHKSTAISLGIKERLMNVDGVQVNENIRGDGLASAMYEFLVQHEHFVILGDEIQYFGARRLWARLSKHLKLQVDIVDVDEGVYLEKDVKIYHGLEDFQFDERVWDYSAHKKHIRLILKKIEH